MIICPKRKAIPMRVQRDACLIALGLDPAALKARKMTDQAMSYWQKLGPALVEGLVVICVFFPGYHLFSWLLGTEIVPNYGTLFIISTMSYWHGRYRTGIFDGKPYP